LKDIYLGLDIGSTTVKVVVLDRARTLIAHRYLRANGRPRQTLLWVVEDLFQHCDPSQVRAVGLTGSGGESIARLIGGRHVNELISQTRAVGEFYPEARTVIEIGGQDSKFLSLEWDDKAGRMILVDFAMNSVCAAGTGSFLDQQADRLGISIEDEFSALALQSRNPARVAGRCTVFAKSDMIHLQQKGTPLPDILAGLCLALARNFKSVIGKGKAFAPPILFQGGVAYNRGVVQAFESVLNLEPGQLIVPHNHSLMSALGTAFITMDEEAEGNLPRFHGFTPLTDNVRTGGNDRKSMPPLSDYECQVAGGELAPIPDTRHGTPEPVYLGIDIGSISTNVVLIDEQARVVARRYLRTAGEPLEAVRRALREIGQETEGRVRVQSVGTTGSGRYLTGDFVGSDVIRNEIVAQARAATAVDPTVDTVFEIGGQDSKYMRLDHGTVVDFALNKACAAGTGSFLEEQAERLKIGMKEDFSRLALSASSPICLGQRCTVFMESDLIHHQQQGARADELTAGLAYSIAQNYLNRVVNGRSVGKNIFFQGGVAGNQSVVAAFRALTGRQITVPAHHDVSGAIGVAILAMEELAEGRTRSEGSGRGEGTGDWPMTKFKGFDLSTRRYQATVFECKACPNLCEVSKVVISGEPPMFYGARCDKFEEAGRAGDRRKRQIPDLFAKRDARLMGDYVPPNSRRNGRLRLAIPRALVFYDVFPYWRAFFKTLDIELVVSAPTNPKIVRDTSEHAAAETCFPAKLLYGHVIDLLDQAADFMFLPSVVNRESVGLGRVHNTYCPFIPAAAHLITAHLDLEARGHRPLKFPLHMLWEKTRNRELNLLADQLGVSRRRIAKAAAAADVAQQEFYASVRREGREILDSLDDDQVAAVIVGRPYNTCDVGACQDLPFKLRKLGVLPIPMDYLPLDTVEVSARYENMFWRSGQDILAAATIIRDDPRLHAIYLTNFNCGPDSFIINFFREIMGEKPFLELEIDDHMADAGIITRCEAFFESVRMGRGVLRTR
jgi:predicted CoA-substrate-specific enzyme activase